MSDVTIKQLAKVLGMSADRLLVQLGEAGMRFSDPGDVVSDAEKQSLLSFLRNNHGKQDKAEAKVGSPERITLRRRKVSELRVSSGTGRGASSKTVNVEVRAKRTYVRRADATDDADLAEEREDARRRLRESHEQREREQVELDARKQRREEAARLAAEKKAAGAAGAQPDVGAAAPADDESTPVEGVADAPQVDSEAPAPVEAAQTDTPPVSATEPVVSDPADSDVETPASAPPADETDDSDDDASAQKSAWDVPVMPHIYARRKHHKKPEGEAAPGTPAAAAAPKAAAPKAAAQADAPARKRADRHAAAPDDEDRDTDKHGKKRVRGGKLHLSEQDRARRGSSRRRGRSGAAQTVAASSSHGFSRPTAPVVREVPIGDVNQVTDLAQKMAVKGAEVVKALFKMGVMATINQTVDHDTAQLVVEELGHKPVDAEERTAETTLLEQAATVEEEGTKESRPPVVTIMGHVDHGKTSLLDHIRRTKVAAGEAGGITQHIGAYHVTTDRGVITFLDTPGHAAFTAMRARGAKSTDIVVLVVAADDGVKPQTIEAIDHARAAHVPLIVAINKIDKDDANVDNVKQALASHEVVPEDWGGDVQCVPLSAKTGQGVDDLLSAILLQAELMELKAVVDGPASGTVIESRLDRGRGPVATMLVQHGTLKKGDFVVCGVEYGRMRALVGADGKRMDSAGPSIPVQVLGLSGVPAAGDDFVCVADEKLAKQVAEERLERRRESKMMTKANRLEDIMARMGQGETQQVLNILVKADVQGSAEALREALSEIGNDMVKVNVIASGVGGITESDATLAVASKALLIGFNVRADASARKVVETNGVDMRYFSIIYDVIDQVTQAASGLLGNEVREDIIGTAEVRDVFRSSRFGAVAGCIVSEGVVRHNKPIRVLREHTVVFEGELESLRRFKDNVEEVHAGTECGIAVKKYNDVQPGDQIECFERVEVARTL